MDPMTPEERDAPIYGTFKELYSRGFSLDIGICVFVAGIHIAAIALGVWAAVLAPGEWALITGIWALSHFVLGSVSTTLYCRL